MGREQPPLDYDGAPQGHLVVTGTVLWRVHSLRRLPGQFKPAGAGLATGRFDGTPGDPYPTLYVAFDEVTALAEVLLRSVPFDREGWRHLPYETVRERRLSAVRATEELRVVNLIDSDGLSAVCQNEWLISCPEKDFPHTREWASWLRAQDPGAAGIIWTTRRRLVHRSLILFGDRASGLEAAGLRHTDLGEPDGLAQVNAWLRPFRASVNPPL